MKIESQTKSSQLKRNHWFEKLNAEAVLPATLYGGKASQLAELMRLGAQVPPGVALHAEFFEELARVCGIGDALETLRLEPSLERITDTARQLIVDADDDITYFEPLFEALDSVPKPWIVRSSAIGEDGAQGSFAGQLESIGGVTTHTELVQALKACWASRWSTRVLSYERALKRELQGVGVVVQSEITSKVAGVVFTRSPLSFDSLMIEYCDGPGERLVSGEVNPVRVSVERQGARFDVQERGDIPECLEPSVEAELISSLQREALSLEARREEPLDLEWVMDENHELYFVQMRPITVLKAQDKSGPGARVVWSNANMNENYPEPVTPLLASIATKAYHHYFEGLGRAFGVEESRIEMMQAPLRHLVGVHGGRLYYNLTNIYAILQAAPFHSYLIPYWNQFIGVEDGLAEDEPEFRADTVDVQIRPHAFRETLKMLRSTLGWVRSLEARIERFEGRVDDFARRCERRALSEASMSDLVVSFRAFLKIRFEYWTDAALADAASTVSFGLLRAVLNGLDTVQDPATVARELLEGGPPVESGKPIEALWDLSREIRRENDWLTLFDESPDVILDALNEGECPGLKSQFDICVDRWGFRVSGELLLTKPSLDEDPVQAITLVKAFVALGDEHAPATIQQARQERAEAKLAVLGESFGSALRRATSLRWRALLRSVTAVQKSIGYRERARLKQSLLYNRFRRLVLEMGDRLVRARHLGSADDIFYLRFEEIDDLAGGHTLYPQTLASVIESRRDAHARAYQDEPPNTVVLREGEHYQPSSKGSKKGNASAESAGDVLSGTGACSGRVEGTARVLMSMAEAARFQKGDILVAKQTDPGWGPLFVLAGGLVLERGGLLSHGAIVAREFGIPAVVGVEGAFSSIADGARLEVDGDDGSVSLLES